MIQVRILGGFSLKGEGIPRDTEISSRQQALLAYLVLHRDAPQPRRQIAFQFWPDSTDAQAQTNLRQLLHHIRHTFPALTPAIYSDGQNLYWRDDVDCQIDVVEFLQLLDHAAHVHEDDSVDLLERAIALYRGDLFPDCYDNWILLHREQLRQRYLDALQQVIELRLARRELAQAISNAERLIAYDPLHEVGYQLLMQLHALNHNRAAALRVYHVCATTLERDLGVRPGPDTRSQYEHLLHLEDSPGPPPIVGGKIPLVGRAREWAKLRQAWDQARAGRTHFVLIRGEAGIGKTRLLEEIGRWAAVQGATVAQARAYLGQAHLVYAAVISWLRSPSMQAGLAKLDEIWLSEAARLLPELLIEHPYLPPPQPLRDSWQRQRFYDALTHAVMNSVEPGKPLVLILDDLQWCDGETLAWLSYLLPSAANRPLLFAAAVRTGEVEADHPLQSTLAVWRQERGLTEVLPRPLSPEETAELAAAVTERAWSPEDAAVLFRETEGNPLFVVELVRAGPRSRQESPAAQRHTTDALPSFTRAAQSDHHELFLPPQIQATIEFRLNHLSDTAREVANLAAVIGREFRFDVLAQASKLDEETLVRGLDELWIRRIIREQGSDAYDFSHDKIRAVAYGQISAARRRLLHRHAAEALRVVHAGNLAQVSGQVAHHYEQAQTVVEAIDFYRQAAGAAQRVYANQDVVTFLERALLLLAEEPSGSARDSLELSILADLGPPLVALEGYSGRRVTAVYNRMLDLCAQLDHPPDPRALRGLALVHVLQARHARSAALGEQILALQATAGDPVLKVEGHYVVGVASFWAGKLDRAREHLEMALSHYFPDRRHLHLARYAQDPALICRARLAYTLWHLGDSARAWQMMDAATQSAETEVHPYSLTYAHIFAAIMARDDGNQPRFEKAVTALLALTAKHEFGFLYHSTLLWEGVAQVWRGELVTGIERIVTIIQHFADNEIYLLRPIYLAWLAHAQRQAGRDEQALRTVSEALEIVEARGERHYEAELRRLQGEWLWAQGETLDSVQKHFTAALDVARNQNARRLELRALLSLYHLWDETGNLEEAAATRDALQALYEYFEGQPAPDLQETYAILHSGRMAVA